MSPDVVSPYPTSASDSEGDSLALNALTDGFVQGGTLYCGNEYQFESQEELGFCGLISLNDSVSGSEAPSNNVQSVAVYDACGTLVMSGSLYDWYTIGYSDLHSGTWLYSDTLDIPVSGLCSGTWTVVYTFSETFTDGQTLSVGIAYPYTATLVTPAPPTAYGQGSGQASRYDPTCNGGDPVNCASGNFSETYTDFSVPGRGPALDLSRTYNSQAAATAGLFGYGWTSSYEAHLTFNSDGSVTVTEGDGSQVTATSDGSGGYTVPGWADSTLAQNGDGSWTFVRQQRTTYTFNSTGQLTSIADLNGYATTLAYNASGQLSTVTDPEGRALSFSYGSNGFVSQVSGSDSESVSYGYDSNGNLTSVTDAMNREWQFGYDSNHLLTTLTDPKLQQTVNVYNSSAQVTQQTDPAGLVTQFSYSGDNFSSSGGTTTITGPHGEVTVEDYNSGLLLDMTKGSGTSAAGEWFYYYDPTTLAPRAITNPDGQTTTMTYDSSGDLTEEDTPTGNTVYVYNGLDEPTLIQDPRGIQTQYAYDADGNVQTKTVYGVQGTPGETTTYSYTDGHPGDVTEIQDPAGHVTDYSYDQYGDLASVATHPKTGVSDTTQYVYDVLGRKVCEASPNATTAGVNCPAAGQPRVAKTTTWVYNADGAVTSTTDADGNATLYQYDADGNRTQTTDPNGNVVKTTFDADSRPLTVTSGYGTSSAATTTYGYDIPPGTGACSSSVSGTAYCTTVTDPSGEVTVDYLNARDEQIQATSPESGTTTSTYDAVGNMLTQTTPAGLATYQYDADNRVAEISYSNPATGFKAAPNVTYVYDQDGNRTSMTDGSGTTTYTYDSLERLTSVQNGAGTTITYGYDNDGEVTSIGYPSTSRKGGTLTVTQGYDGAGQETSVTDWLGHTTNFTYDADGNITSEAYPNTTTATSSYDAADNLLSTADALNSTPNSPFAQMTYTYNADSQVATENDTGLPGPGSATYSYDPLSRLTSTGSSSYSYDTAGDPTQLGTSTPTVGTTHQITSLAQTITKVGTSSAGDAGTGSTLSVPLPTGTVPNDQILLAVTLPGNESIKTTPTGYTLVGKYSSGTTASAIQLVVYRRTAQAGDTTASITFSKTFAKAATVIVYSGVDPANPIDTTSSGTTTSGTSVTALSLTTTAANDQLVLAQAALSSTAGTWTPPTGMTSRITQAGGTAIANTISDEADPTKGATGSQTATFSTSGALAAAMIALRPAQTTYTYNALGARATATTSSGTTNIGYNQAGQMTSYGTTTYAYNGDGLRISKTVGSTTESFTYGQATNGGETPPLLIDGSTDYIYGPGGLPLEQVNGSTVLYYLHDQLGSTRALTNSSGATVATYTYGPYGNVAGQTGSATNPLQFAGAYTDSESGLIYLGARYYDPTTGQFTSVDPLQQLTEQPYAYADDNPIMNIDPSGLCGFFSCISDAVNTIENDASSGWNDIETGASTVGNAIGTGVSTGWDGVEAGATWAYDHPVDAAGLVFGAASLATGVGEVAGGIGAVTAETLDAVSTGTGLVATTLDGVACARGDKLSCIAAGIGGAGLGFGVAGNDAAALSGGGLAFGIDVYGAWTADDESTAGSGRGYGASTEQETCA